MRACVALILMATSGCASSSRATSVPRIGSSESDTYPLWSDGWKPGDFEMLALAAGPFHASVTNGQACAWLGDGDNQSAVRWPAG